MKGLYHAWRSNDPDALELDTDPVVQGEGFRYLKRRMLRDLLVILLCLGVIVGCVAGRWLSGRTPLLTTLERGLPLLGLVGGLYLLFALVLEAVNIRAMRRLLRTLKTGIPLERPRPYLWQKRLAQALQGLRVVFWTLYLISTLPGPLIGPAFTAHVGNDEAPKQGEVYVDLRALDGLPEDRVHYSRTESKFHELAPRMYWCIQDGYDGSRTETAYYHLLLPALAPVLERDLLEYGTSVGISKLDVETPMEAQEPGGLDSFWWRSAGNWQTVLAVRGRNVLYVRYEGPTDLRTAGDYFAALLKEGYPC